MKVFQLPIEMVNALRSWFHPKDRSVILADDTFIEGEEIATPGNPPHNRGAAVLEEWTLDTVEF